MKKIKKIIYFLKQNTIKLNMVNRYIYIVLYCIE
jgi:hypothetical protein